MAVFAVLCIPVIGQNTDVLKEDDVHSPIASDITSSKDSKTNDVTNINEVADNIEDVPPTTSLTPLLEAGSSSEAGCESGSDEGSDSAYQKGIRFRVEPVESDPEETPNNINTPLPSSNCGVDDDKKSQASIKVVEGEEIEMEIEEFTLVEAVQLTLGGLGIDQDVWQEAEDKMSLQVTFVIQVVQCDVVLRSLTNLGIGKLPNTSISLFPANYHMGQSLEIQKSDVQSQNVQNEASTVEKKSTFMKTINSRLLVAQVVDNVRASSCLTFDFLMFVTLASIIAAVGLAENSSVVLVASMLVSPIMGPILGGVFGLVVKHRSLWKLGVRNELISLTICITCGFAIGLVTGAISSQGAQWWSTDEWPTMEMKSRGMLRGLLVGMVIALPSGAGVALSVLGGNSGSLVGVAISASLLPPAVNAGMLWAYSVTSAITPPPLLLDNLVTMATPTASEHLTTAYTATVSNTAENVTVVAYTATPTPAYPTPPGCPPLRDNAYQFVYSCSMPHEAAIMGAISLLLTLINIICIFIMGVIILKVKEVAPEKAVSEGTRSFWKKDIKVARQSYQTMKPTSEGILTTRQFAKEIAAEYKDTIFPNKPGQAVKQSWTKMLETIKEDDEFCNANTLDNLGIKDRPQIFRQLSDAAESVMGEKIDAEEKRKYHTVSAVSDIQLNTVTNVPDTPMFDLPSPFTPPSVVRRRRGLLRSPAGMQEFLYDPSALQKRCHRQSLELMRKRHPSVPHNIKFPEQTSAIHKSASGRFVISPVAEESTVA